MPDPTDFIELSDFWTSISRRDDYPPGFGKWMLATEDPQRLYQILREKIIAGALKETGSLKTKSEPPGDGKPGAVYIYTAPYNDQERVLKVADELRQLNGAHNFRLTGPLLYKSDLHNTWAETIARPGDGYFELLKRNWLYRYEDGKLIVNAVIQSLHQALEDPPENADPEFLIIRSLLPGELFAGINNSD